MDRHIIETALVAVSVNPLEFLMLAEEDGYELPRRYLKSDESTFSVAAELLRTHLGQEPRLNGVGWITLFSTPPVDNVDRAYGDDRVITVPYVCMVPASVCPARGARWVSHKELREGRVYKDHLDIALTVTRRL